MDKPTSVSFAVMRFTELVIVYICLESFTLGTFFGPWMITLKLTNKETNKAKRTSESLRD